MTTLTAAVSTATCRVCANVAAWFKLTLQRIQFARQMAANRRVAQDLIGLGFEQQKEYDQILQKMSTCPLLIKLKNDRTINEYHGKY